MRYAVVNSDYVNKSQCRRLYDGHVKQIYATFTEAEMDVRKRCQLRSVKMLVIAIACDQVEVDDVIDFKPSDIVYPICGHYAPLSEPVDFEKLIYAVIDITYMLSTTAHNSEHVVIQPHETIVGLHRNIDDAISDVNFRTVNGKRYGVITLNDFDIKDEIAVGDVVEYPTSEDIIYPFNLSCGAGQHGLASPWIKRWSIIN